MQQMQLNRFRIHQNMQTTLYYRRAVHSVVLALKIVDEAGSHMLSIWMWKLRGNYILFLSLHPLTSHKSGRIDTNKQDTELKTTVEDISYCRDMIRQLGHQSLDLTNLMNNEV